MTATAPHVPGYLFTFHEAQEAPSWRRTARWDVQRADEYRSFVGHYTTPERAMAAAKRDAKVRAADEAIFEAAEAASTTIWRRCQGSDDVTAFYGPEGIVWGAEVEPGEKVAFFSRGSFRTGVVESVKRTGSVSVCYVSSTGRMTRLTIKAGERALLGRVVPAEERDLGPLSDLVVGGDE